MSVLKKIFQKKIKKGKKRLTRPVIIVEGNHAGPSAGQERRKKMFHIVAISVYYCSLGYVAVAGIIYLASLLVILTDGEKCFFNRIGKKPAARKYRVAMAVLAPLVFALGWGFLIPFKNIRPNHIR